MKSRILAAALTAGLTIGGWAGSASASAVLIQDGTVFSSGQLNTYYNGLAGVTSSLLNSSTPLTSSLFSGIDLFVAAPPQNPYSAAELSEIGSFINGGGTAFLMGENNGFPTSNNAVNAVASAIGSSLSITPAALSPASGCGIGTSTGATLVGSTMAGVGAFTWGCGSIVNGGVAELLRDDLSTVMMASEAIGAGTLIVMADGNISVTTTGNQQFFSNLLSLSSTEVSEPGMLAVFGLGLAGIGYARRRKAA